MAYLSTPEVDGTNYARLFALAPAAYDGWATLNVAIRSAMDLRRYELVTLAAARRLGSSYCSMAHGSLLRDRFFTADQVRRIAADHHDAGLDPADVAPMDLAERVVTDPRGITDGDVAALRELGLSERDVLDVVLTAAARCFFATVLDALGVEPDASYRADLDPRLLDLLTVGRSAAVA
ncbi:carboxymuconolactone decarboxylase family protein [Nocardioides sp. SR21]|uniref:carboxymuconolactone decarboxylase family protein n=1 Tax=Nocardioides sp. SR21 TaxID=2919501 RepID=UPI001FA9C823|nr:carboxymuconolactone decarboxylase family protein [Nocardioides sp. SR21]